MSALRPLYPHQERAIVPLRGSCVSGKKQPMLQAPPGFGKTLIQRALDKGKSLALAVPALSLIEQTVAYAKSQGRVAHG